MLQVVDGTGKPSYGVAVTGDDGSLNGATPHEAGGAANIATVSEEGGANQAEGVALVVAHRGVIRIIAKRLAGVEPVIELGSIQILQRDRIGDSWHAELVDVVEHLAESD